MAPDLERLEAAFRELIAGDPTEAGRPMGDLFAAGGKRLRPALVLLWARLGDYDFEVLRHAAAAVELMHAATLVHDDVIDRSATRRGRPTVAVQRGSEAAILVGDYYFAKAYTEAAATGTALVVGELAAAVMRICAGELRAQRDVRRYHRPVAAYLEHIALKTGALTAAACRIGALLGGLSPAQLEAAGEYGGRLGEAFQIADDVLDYTGEEQEVGKPVGHDLLEGSATLPLLLAFESGHRRRLEELLVDGEPAYAATVGAVVDAVRASGAPEQALKRARASAARAVETLRALPAGEAHDALTGLATYVVERKL